MSRELDRQVAEKVFGYQIIESWDGDKAEAEKRGKVYAELYFGGDQEEIPHYSSKAEDSQLVVKRMHELGYDIDLFACHDGYSVVGFTCQYGPCVRHGTSTNNWHGVKDIKAETTDEAICQAALQALKSPTPSQPTGEGKG